MSLLRIRVRRVLRKFRRMKNSRVLRVRIVRRVRPRGLWLEAISVVFSTDLSSTTAVIFHPMIINQIYIASHQFIQQSHQTTIQKDPPPPLTIPSCCLFSLEFGQIRFLYLQKLHHNISFLYTNNNKVKSIIAIFRIGSFSQKDYKYIWMIKFAEILQDCSENEEEMIKKHKKDFVFIRKQNRQQIFNKRRKVDTLKYQHQGGEGREIVDKGDLSILKDSISMKMYYERKYETLKLGDLLGFVKGGSEELLFQGVIGIRRILSIQEAPPIQEVLDEGLLELFLNLMQNHSHPTIRTQSAWAIANLCSGSTLQCAKIVSSKTVQIVIQLLNENDLSLVQQLVWILGNLASDCIAYRNLIINLGAISKMIKIFQGQHIKTITKHVCWALSNICRGYPLVNFELVKEAIEKLAYIAAGNQIADQQTFSDVCWAISNYTDASKKRSYFIIENNLVYKLVPVLMESQNKELLVPCIRILGGLTTAGPSEISELFKTNIMQGLINLISHKNKTIRRQICWVLSNIAASNIDHTQHIIGNELLMTKMIKLLEEDHQQVRKELIFIFTNLCHSCKDLDLDYYYYEIGLIKFYNDLLNSKFKIIVSDTLDSLCQLLRFSENKIKKREDKTNFFAQKLKEEGVTNVIQSLQNHQSDDVYDLVTNILTTYYTLEDPLAFSADERKHQLQKLSFKNTHFKAS